jgi:hypothetical protein
LDFHAIPHRGEDTGLENHYVPMRGKAVPTVLTCFARAVDAPMLCYVHADVVLTVLANGCYRWLSQRLKGCERMEPKHLYRKFVETGGHLTIRGDELIVSFDRRAHNPVIAQARLDQDAPSIPWLHKRLHLEFK